MEMVVLNSLEVSELAGMTKEYRQQCAYYDVSGGRTETVSTTASTSG
jgi:hypothetical protein